MINLIRPHTSYQMSLTNRAKQHQLRARINIIFKGQKSKILITVIIKMAIR